MDKTEVEAGSRLMSNLYGNIKPRDNVGYEAIKKLNVRHSAIFLIFVMTWKTIKRGGGPDITFYYRISPPLTQDHYIRVSKMLHCVKGNFSGVRA